MSLPVDFYFDYVSPYAYLANTQLPRLGLDIRHRPISITEVMGIVNNHPSPMCPPKLRHAMRDTARWAKRYGVPLEVNQAWWNGIGTGQVDLRLHMKGALAAQKLGHFEAYHHVIWEAIYARPRPVAGPVETQALLEASGLPGREILALALESDIEQKLDAENAAAAEAGVFGVPKFLVEGEVYFGGDRLDFVREHALGASTKVAA